MDRYNENATFDPKSNYNGLEISANATILEEGLRVCPLCQSEIKLFFINFNEKLLMCENVECEYPFGNEDLQFFKEDNTVNSMDELCSIRSTRSKPTADENSATYSVLSHTAWSDIERMNRIFESEDSQFELRHHTKSKQNREEERKKDEKIMQNIHTIQDLNKELKEINQLNKRKITNNKYIKNLLSIQEMSGVELLEPEEMKIVEKVHDRSCPVKIDVNTDPGGSVSCIKIELVDITNLEAAAREENNSNNNVES